MKRIWLLFTIIITIGLAATAAWCAGRLRNPHQTAFSQVLPSVHDLMLSEKMTAIAVMAKQYTLRNQFNTRFCFLIDMSISSGKSRFFVYDMDKNVICMNGLVAHGRCNQNWLAGRQYGNVPGCGCTSLGKYRIGQRYQGIFGPAYKLYGLDATNSNAYHRFVVLHSMQCVPELEVDPLPICQSDGCPSVSPGFLQQLSSFINNSKQPILLWIAG